MIEEATCVSAPDLWRLSVSERCLSGIRRRLHAQIDDGADDESIRVRERQISTERRALHKQIDELQAARARQMT